MKYRKGYKYQIVEEDVVIFLPYWWMGETGKKVSTDISGFIELNGLMLTINVGYAWDGASGIPDIANKEAALIHDALYQLLREGKLDIKYKDKADKIFEKFCVMDGTPKWLAHIYYIGLKKFGNKAATEKKKVYYA